MRISTKLHPPLAAFSLAAISVLVIAGCASSGGENGGKVVSGSEISSGKQSEQGSKGPVDKDSESTEEPVIGENNPGEVSTEAAFPSEEEFAEEVEQAKSMTEKELVEYLDAKAEEVLTAYDEATKEESAQAQERMEEISTSYGEERDALATEYSKALEDAGTVVATEILLDIEKEFADRRTELERWREEEVLKIQQWFDEETKDVQAEFAPRFLESEARAYYMKKAQEGQK